MSIGVYCTWCTYHGCIYMSNTCLSVQQQPHTGILSWGLRKYNMHTRTRDVRVDSPFTYIHTHTHAKILTKTLTKTSVHPLAVHRHTILIMHWRAYRARCFPSWHSREFVETFQSFALRTTDGWPFIIFEQNRVTLEPVAVVIISSVNIIYYV